MASKNSKDRYQKFIDAGKAVSRLTGERFEEVAKDLIHLSNVQRSQAQELVEDVMKRSKKSTEFIVDAVKGEVEKQLKGLKIASREDLTTVSERLTQMKADIAALAAMREDLKQDLVKLTEAVSHLVQRKDTSADNGHKSDGSSIVNEPVVTKPSKPEVNKRPSPSRSRAKTPPKPDSETGA